WDWLSPAIPLHFPEPPTDRTPGFDPKGHKKAPTFVEAFFCDPAGIRTQDPYIKSVLLYLLSYGILLRFLKHRFVVCSAAIECCSNNIINILSLLYILKQN